MIGIFLDDERNPDDVTWMQYAPSYPSIQWTVVRNKSQFDNMVEFILGVGIEIVVSFDHDLQDFTDSKENTGYDCLKSLVNFCIDNGTQLPVCFFHTQNPVGKANMRAYYENAKKHLV